MNIHHCIHYLNEQNTPGHLSLDLGTKKWGIPSVILGESLSKVSVVYQEEHLFQFQEKIQ